MVFSQLRGDAEVTRRKPLRKNSKGNGKSKSHGGKTEKFQPGHGLKDEQVGAISNDAAAFIAGLRHGVELARGKRWPGSFQYSGMALLKHEDGHYEIAEMRKVIDDIKRFEGKAFPYEWRELFGDETPREFRFNRGDIDESGERNERVLLDGRPVRRKNRE